MRYIRMEDKRVMKGWDAFGKIQVIKTGEEEEVLIEGKKYMSWESGDEGSKKMAVAQLCKIGKASQEEIAKAFGIHNNTVYNYINAYKGDEIRGLLSQVSSE